VATRATRATGARALACVLGEIDLLRALGEAGIPCAAVARPGHPTRYSRYAAETVEWADPHAEGETLVGRLLEFARAQAEPPVLFYDGDWDLLLVSRERERLRPHLRYVVADAELVEDLVDKARFARLAERLELPVPPCRVLPAGAEPDLDGLRFPLVVKPLTRDHASWRPVARAKAVTVSDAAGLARVLEQGGGGIDLLVQELVPGAESRIESYHAYVDESGAVAGEFTGRKLRTHPARYGYSTALVISDAPDVLALGRDVVERLGLRGVAKLDVKRAPDGRLLLLEMNPRFNLWHWPGARAGVDLPALVYADLTGGPRPPRRAARAGVRWCNVPRDVQAMRGGGVGLVPWLGWALGAETKGVVSLRDPLPLLGASAFRLRRLAARKAGR